MEICVVSLSYKDDMKVTVDFSIDQILEINYIASVALSFNVLRRITVSRTRSMTKNQQINNDNNKNSGTLPLSSGETKQNSLSHTLAQIEVTPLMIGVAAVVVTAATYACASRFKARSVSPISRKFYKGGFKPQMTRREAALILGVRGSITTDKVTEAHRRVMVANHPDIGGSHYLASKINEAKYKLIRKPNNTDSVFSYDLTVDSDSD
ncbi:hypothetical protein Lser_V15G28484 [Lactuca serriola]